MYKAPIHYTAQHKATAVHNGKYVPGGEREGAQTWNFMNHISLSFVRMQMPTHKLTVQVLDNTYRQYIRQYSTRGKFRPVYLCLITFFQFKIAPQIFCTDSADPSVDPYWIFILFGRKTFSERVSVLAVDTFRAYCTAQ